MTIFGSLGPTTISYSACSFLEAGINYTFLILGKDTCRGDSGGPLISKQGPKEVMYLKGIVSFGTSKCGQGTPGVFTNVAYYMDWIRTNMKP